MSGRGRTVDSGRPVAERAFWFWFSRSAFRTRSTGPQSHLGNKKEMDQKKYVVASMKGLESWKRAENIINRKMGCFYIEAMTKIFSQVRKSIFCWDLKKTNKKKLQHFRTKTENFQNPIENHPYDFRLDFENFWFWSEKVAVVYLFFILRSQQKIIFRTWEKMLGIASM